MAKKNTGKRENNWLRRFLRRKGERAELIEVPGDKQPLQRINLTIMICAGVAIVVGFLLMLGGSSTTEQFNPDIFSTRRIVIGPTIAFLGFVAMGVGIIYSRKKSKGVSKNEPESEK